jgi:hypothetical protein
VLGEEPYNSLINKEKKDHKEIVRIKEFR